MKFVNASAMILALGLASTDAFTNPSIAGIGIGIGNGIGIRSSTTEANLFGSMKVKRSFRRIFPRQAKARGEGYGAPLENVSEMIGNTPMVKLSDEMTESPGVTVYAKAEFCNPLSSVKDRLALSIIETAEKEGKLKPGDTVIEATSGNTGIAVAMMCAQRGYKCVIIMAEPFSVERRKLMRMLGAKVIVTPKAGKSTRRPPGPKLSTIWQKSARLLIIGLPDTEPAEPFTVPVSTSRASLPTARLSWRNPGLPLWSIVEFPRSAMPMEVPLPRIRPFRRIPSRDGRPISFLWFWSRV